MKQTNKLIINTLYRSTRILLDYPRETITRTHSNVLAYRAACNVTIQKM